MESVTLYYKQGSSDKVYQARIEASGGGFTVPVAWGRRGSTMQTGCKTTAGPVTLEKAQGIFAKVVAAKVAEGYTEGPDGTPYQGGELAARDSGFRPQLLNNVESNADVLALVRDDAWGAQEKLDGKRLLVSKVGQVVTGINRKGLTVPLPVAIVQDLSLVPHDFVIDGEAIGDVLHAFDILVLDDMDGRKAGYGRRHLILNETFGSGAVKVAPLIVGTEAKTVFLRDLIEANAEGVVFKRLDAPYVAGRPSSGGTQLKYKFYATASCIVATVNAQRSVGLALLQDGERVDVGNVTIPPNAAIPSVCAIIEVRYLYAYRGGHLYQPVFEGVRDDLDLATCQLSQLKYKREEEEEA